MNKLYIVETSYVPTAAATNRLFAFGLSLVKKGVSVKFIYLTPDAECHKSDRYTDVFEFEYLWDNNWSKNKYWCAFWNIRRLRKMMHPGVPVYVYSSLNFLPFIKKDGCKVFHEYTENPDIVGRVHNFVGEWFYKKYIKAVQKVNGIFVITPSLKKLYEEKYCVDPAKIEVLNMVVDPRRFDDLQQIEATDEISYCGYISEFKDGVSTLIDAFAKFILTHHTFKLNLYGRFESEETRLKIENKIRDLRLDGKVILPGSVSPSDMPQLLRKSKILTLARPDNIQAKYGFATKIGEYLLAERPVVMTNVGDFSLFLNDGVDVIMAEPDNVDDFAQKLSWVADNYAEAEVIAKQGKHTALKLFNSEIEGEKIYNRIFGS